MYRICIHLRSSLSSLGVSLLLLWCSLAAVAVDIAGRIDGTFEQYPDTAEMTRHDFHVLVDLNDVVRDYPNTSFVTSRAYLKKNPEAVKKFLMAMARHTIPDDFTVEHTERREQGRRPMALVVVRLTGRYPGTQQQQRLGSVQ